MVPAGRLPVPGCLLRTLRKPAVADEEELPEEEAEVPGYRSAWNIATRTFKLIREFKTPPIPKAYEVLYTYVSSDRALVKVRVDEAVKRDGVLNLYDVDQIHADFFSYPEAIHNRHDETAGNMDAELDNLLSLISDQVGVSGKYSQSLETAGASLSNGVTVQVLRSTIKVLLTENHAGARAKSGNRDAVGVLSRSDQDDQEEPRICTRGRSPRCPDGACAIADTLIGSCHTRSNAHARTRPRFPFASSTLITSSR